MTNKQLDWSSKCYNNNIYKVDLNQLYVNSEWREFFDDVDTHAKLEQISAFLSQRLTDTLGKLSVYPYPDNCFKCFNFTPLSRIKVVILGQDPYFNCTNLQNPTPQATGLAFSVNYSTSIPSSLMNIYKNLQKFGHIRSIPEHGNLEFWAHQGCLLLNTSLTVEHGHPNSHSRRWEILTNELIKFISDKRNNIVFVLWGASALKKQVLIDEKKHMCTVSSHPSGLSCNKPLGTHQPFCNTDHFSLINRYLTKHNKDKIIWNLGKKI